MLFILMALALLVPGAEPGDAGVSTGESESALADAGSPERETLVHASSAVDSRRIAGSAQVIGKDELERQENNDIHRVLQSVAGVYVRDEDGFGLRPNIGLRGVNADRSSKVTLMEDGVLLGPAPYSAAAAYYFPLVTRMVGVEVYKGPASIRFGPQTIGGAVNLRTREIPTAWASDIDVSLGSYGSGKAHAWLGAGDEHKGLLIEAVTLGSDGFKVIDGGGPTGFLKGEVMAKGRWFTDSSRWWRTGVELKLGLATEDSHETYLGLTDEDFAAAPYRRYSSSANDEMKWLRTQVELTHVLTLGDRFALRTTVYRHDQDRDWHRMQQFRAGPELYQLLTLPTDSRSEPYLRVLKGEVDSVGPDQQLLQAFNRRVFVSQGVQTAATLKIETGPVTHAFELGARLHADSIRRLHSQLAFDTREGKLVADSAGPFSVLNNLDSSLAFAAYLNDTISWGHLLVSPGVRIESISVSSRDVDSGAVITGGSLVPLLGVGAVYTFSPGVSLLGGVHQGFSPVNPGQDASVRPEQAVNAELGVRLSGRGLRLETIGFWSEYSNITGECTGSTGCVGGELNRQFNGGRARVLGAEVLAGARAKGPWETMLAADLNYTFTHATFQSDFTSENSIWGNVQAGDFLPYVPMHQGQLRGRVAYKNLELGLGANWYGSSRERAGQGEPTANVAIADRVTVDATASYTLNAMRFYFTANNLLDSPALVARLPFGARGQAPRMMQVGFKYEFR